MKEGREGERRGGGREGRGGRREGGREGRGEERGRKGGKRGEERGGKGGRSRQSYLQRKHLEGGKGGITQ